MIIGTVITTMAIAMNPMRNSTLAFRWVVVRWTSRPYRGRFGRAVGSAAGPARRGVT